MQYFLKTELITYKQNTILFSGSNSSCSMGWGEKANSSKWCHYIWNRIGEQAEMKPLNCEFSFQSSDF